MSDNGVWFKLWIGADEDPDLGDLSLEDFARWCKFGLYLKKYGTDGEVTLKPPCFPLQYKFKVPTFQDVLDVLRRFPNCNVTYVTNATVTWKNWQRYQGDNSIDRVRKFRANVTAKKRRDEMRGEEKRINEPTASPHPVDNSIDPSVKQVADLIYASDRPRFTKLTVWIKDKQKRDYPPEVIAGALGQFWDHERQIKVKDWWPYLDRIFTKAYGAWNQEQSQKMKDDERRSVAQLLSFAGK